MRSAYENPFLGAFVKNMTTQIPKGRYAQPFVSVWFNITTDETNSMTQSP